jgi:hypothetical protein
MARVVLELPTSQERTKWRVVVDERPDNHGVLSECRIIEIADLNKQDAMGVQHWKRMTLKDGTLSEWALIAESAITKLLGDT